MGTLTIRLLVRVRSGESATTLDVSADQSESLAAILSRVHLDAHLPGMPTDWQFLRHGGPAPIDADIGDLAGPSGIVELVLVPVPGAFPDSPPAPRSSINLFPATAARTTPSGMYRRGPDSGSVRVGVENGEDTSEDELDAIRQQKTAYSSSKMRALPPGEQRGVVRYADRMALHRESQLTVVLSKAQVANARRRAGVAAGHEAELEVEPVFAGCDCDPQRETLFVRDEPVSASFRLVPRVLGSVPCARVMVRQGGRVIGQVPLRASVGRKPPVLALALPGVGLLLPGLAAWLDPSGVIGMRSAADLLVGVGAALLLAALTCRYFTRTRETDVFWEVATRPGE
jgi:hypothetical protein